MLAIDLKNVTVSYDKRPVLRGVSLSIESGQLVGLIGPNGGGKTTLLKAIMGLVPLDNGRVFLYDKTLDVNRRLIAYIPQKESVDWDYPVVVSDVVMMGRYGHLGWIRRPGKRDYEIAVKALEQVEMSPYADRQIGQLSGGQQQRVFLARALAQEAQTLLLDEPFAGVDAATERAIFSLMTKLKDEGKTLLVVNHDLSNNNIKNFNSLILLNQRLVAYGPTAQVFTPELLRKAYGGRLTMLQQVENFMEMER